MSSSSSSDSSGSDSSSSSTEDRRRVWRPSASADPERSLEAWMGSFPSEAWESLAATVSSLPDGLQQALRCSVHGMSLPLSMVLQSRQLVATPAVEPMANDPPPCVVEEADAVEPAATPQPPCVGDAPPEVAPPPSDPRACGICGVIPPHMRRHVEEQHLPFWFHGDAACFHCNEYLATAAIRLTHEEYHGTEAFSVSCGEGYVAWVESMGNFLHELAVAGGVAVSSLPQLFITNGWCPERQGGTQWNISMEFMLRDVARAIDDHCQLRRLDCMQPQHPIEVLHWRSIYNFLVDNPAARPAMRNLEFIRNPPQTTSIRMALPTAVDSHCHLASYLSTQRLPLRAALEMAFEGAFVGSRPELTTPNVAFIVDNRVFRTEWGLPPISPDVHELTGPEGRHAELQVVCSYGVHPKEESQVDWAWLHDKVREPQCVAVGECGLDHTVGRRQQQRQAMLFRRQVHLAVSANKPLILHLRPAGRNCGPILTEALDLLRRERVPRQQRFHLHSFVGNLGDYNRWIRCYPRTIFGVTTATINAPETREIARLADLRRLVLESDAPFLRSTQPGSPYQLNRQAAWIATERGLPARVVQQAAALNAMVFYGLLGGES